MARFILIDQHSGYVFGDTSDFAATRQSDLTPIQAARILDESIGEYGRSYVEHGPRSAASMVQSGGYFVYRADVRSSEGVPVVQDGQNQETIEAVHQDCQLVAFVETRA